MKVSAPPSVEELAACCRAADGRPERLSQAGLLQALEIANYGRHGDGQLVPQMRGGTPVCSICHCLYPAIRLTLDLARPHICCGCTELVEKHERLIGRNGGCRRHLTRIPPWRDDQSSAGRERI